MEFAEIALEKEDFDQRLAFQNPNGYLAFIACRWEIVEGGIIKYKVMAGTASFSLIPARTIIVEQQQSSYCWGLVTECNTKTTEYVNPISIEDI